MKCTLKFWFTALKFMCCSSSKNHLFLHIVIVFEQRPKIPCPAIKSTNKLGNAKHTQLYCQQFRWCCNSSSQLHFNFLMECSIAKVIQGLNAVMRTDYQGISMRHSVPKHWSENAHTHTFVCYWNWKFCNELFSSSWNCEFIVAQTRLNVRWEGSNKQSGLRAGWEMRNECTFEPVIKCTAMRNVNCKGKQNCPSMN